MADKGEKMLNEIEKNEILNISCKGFNKFSYDELIIQNKELKETINHLKDVIIYYSNHPFNQIAADALAWLEKKQ